MSGAATDQYKSSGLSFTSPHQHIKSLLYFDSLSQLLIDSLMENQEMMSSNSTTVDEVNPDVLADILTRISQQLDRVMSQYLLLDGQLAEINTRLRRAEQSHRLPHVYSLQIQRDCTEGMICMYRRFMLIRMTQMSQLLEKFEECLEQLL